MLPPDGYVRATVVGMRVASRELRNDTAGVLRRAGAGESVVITVNGEPWREIVYMGTGRALALDWLDPGGI